jgi:hypothetical protein
MGEAGPRLQILEVNAMMMKFCRGVMLVVATVAVASATDAWAGKPLFSEEFENGPLFNVTELGGLDTGSVSETGVGTVEVFARKNKFSAEIVYKGTVDNASGKKFRIRFKALVEVQSLEHQAFFASFDYSVAKNGAAVVNVTLEGEGFEIPPDIDPTVLGLPFFSGF